MRDAVAGALSRRYCRRQMSLEWPVIDAPVEVPYWWRVVALLLIIAFPPTVTKSHL